ncbi:MAG: hypothetical protein CBC34_017565 [Hyphomicrobiaceae bacterium TMED74]|nr:hypothetical protein [Filomicrobium sp.]RPG37686.1 MAG: hypothetical protein CBC34_017565 [Hyphomicrobiaceae bacterium TMED74]
MARSDIHHTSIFIAFKAAKVGCWPEAVKVDVHDVCVMASAPYLHALVGKANVKGRIVSEGGRVRIAASKFISATRAHYWLFD